MRAYEFLTEAEVTGPKKIGREFNHLEDLVFSEPQGALRAVQVLKDIAQDAKDVALKWDGNPTVYWGRDEDGTFRMVGKNNWGKEEGKSSSPDELKSFIMSRGKGEDWRPKFAGDMAAMWPIFEAATPEDFRGYVYADILYHPGKPFSKDESGISFTPNQTTYTVNPSSSVGKQIAGSKVAVAAHKTLDYFGDKTGKDLDDVKMFNGTSDLVVFGQTYITHQPEVNADNLDVIEKLAKQRSGDIDKLLTPMQGLSDLQDTIYTFVNNQSKVKQLDKIDTQTFLNWIATSKLSGSKQQKVAQLIGSNKEVTDDMFTLVRELMKAKDEVIRELDQAEGDIVAVTGDKPGGEGYVKGKDKVKMVPRDRWTPFRAD